MSQGQAGSEAFKTASVLAAGVQPADPSAFLTVGNNGFIPVNADATNGLGISPTGIPVQRDFNVQPLPVADPDLIRATASYPPGNITKVSLLFNGNGTAALWTDQMKTAPGPGTLPAPTITFFIEGTRPSSFIGDITLIATYISNAPGSQEQTISTTITVTPFVDSFAVNPHPPQSVVFRNSTNGLEGLTTSARGDPNQGAGFDAAVPRTGVGGTGIFIQNFVGVDNGAGGAAAGWVFTATSGLPNLNAVLSPGDTFPILDKVGDPTRSGPDYDVNFSTAGSDANTLRMTATDSPNTGNPANSDKVQNIDITDRIRLYVVWRFADTSIYTLASVDWKVVFQADTNAPGSGVTNIIRPNSAVSANPFVRTNADVPALTAPTFNASITRR
jgi:hypothetical protein